MGLDNREIVTVDFDAQGNPSVDVAGVKGRSCKELTASVERSLGKVVSDHLKQDYHTVEHRNAIKH